MRHSTRGTGKQLKKNSQGRHTGIAVPRHAALATVLFALLSGCGGDDAPSQTGTAGCSGASCSTPIVDPTPPAPPPSTDTPAPVTRLCPTELDYNTTYTGGSAGGEYIKVSFDTTSQRYRMTFVASAVPTAVGQINNTRAGLTIEGDFTHPTTLPSAEQNRCAFVLQNGKTQDGSYTVTINPADPPVLFSGFGLVTGGVPGASMQFDGVTLLGNLGAVPARTFDSFPFIGFAETETDLSQVAGRFHVVGMYVTPQGSSYQTASPQGWEPYPANWTETLNADGSCSPEGTGYSCATTGTPWALRQNLDSSADNVFVSRSVSASSPYTPVGTSQPIVLLAPSSAQGIMIVGKVGNQRIPVIVRVGASNVPLNAGDLLNTVIDGQVGLALLTPATALQADAFDGKFVGVSSAAICGKVDFNGSSGAPAVSTGVFDASVDHPDLPGHYSGTFFTPDAGNCLDGTSTSSPGAIYVGNAFNGASGVQAGATATSMVPSLSLDYAQTIPGKVNVSALQAFNTQDGSGDVALFNAGDAGVMVKNGPVYALIMNPNTYHPFVQFGMALP